MVSGFNSSDLHVAIERNQPPLFRITVPQQTPLGIYTVPLIVTIREPSIATQTKPISTNTTRGVVDPKFELSKKFSNSWLSNQTCEFYSNRDSPYDD